MPPQGNPERRPLTTDAVRQWFAESLHELARQGYTGQLVFTVAARDGRLYAADKQTKETRRGPD